MSDKRSRSRGRVGRRERTPFEGASIVFGAVIMLFGAWGAADSLIGGEGPASVAFGISLVFFLLGAGRVLLGLRGR